MLNHKLISDIIYIHVVFAQLTYLCLNVLNVYRCELLFPISEDLNKKKTYGFTNLREEMFLIKR